MHEVKSSSRDPPNLVPTIDISHFAIFCQFGDAGMELKKKKRFSVITLNCKAFCFLWRFLPPRLPKLQYVD